MDDILSLGVWIKRRRKALDLTQDDLARRVGCSLETIRKIEGDARRPSRQIAALLAEHLALPPKERDAFIRCARAELTIDRLPSPAQTVPHPTLVPAARTQAPVEQPARVILPGGTVTFLFTDIEGSPFWLYDPRREERIVATLHTQLDPDTFAMAWAAGQQMTLEQAIDEALEPLRDRNR